VCREFRAELISAVLCLCVSCVCMCASCACDACTCVSCTCLCASCTCALERVFPVLVCLLLVLMFPVIVIIVLVCLVLVLLVVVFIVCVFLVLERSSSPLCFLLHASATYLPLFFLYLCFLSCEYCIRVSGMCVSCTCVLVLVVFLVHERSSSPLCFDSSGGVIHERS
jgi:hypothetical protein